MKTYRNTQAQKSRIFNVTKTVGVRLEDMITKLKAHGEPIDGTSPLIYTERKDGVLPEYDIRTDKWDVAATAMNVVHKNDAAKGKSVTDATPKKEEKKSSENEPTGTESKGE